MVSKKMKIGFAFACVFVALRVWSEKKVVSFFFSTVRERATRSPTLRSPFITAGALPHRASQPFAFAQFPLAQTTTHRDEDEWGGTMNAELQVRALFTPHCTSSLYARHVGIEPALIQ